MMGMFRIPYVRMISFCYAAYMFAYFFLDVAFYKYAAIEFPNELLAYAQIPNPIKRMATIKWKNINMVQTVGLGPKNP